jgi:hypothetical protein
MDIKGKAHCWFEQSGVFKREFIKLGIPAEDYDIQNNFGETDHTDDLFKAIEDAFDGKPSLIDTISQDDFTLAFFPCIYFCAMSQMAFSFGYTNYRKMNIHEKTEKILERSANREYFFRVCVKMICVFQERGLRLVMENPWSEQTFLKANFVMTPQVVDMNRMLRGDYRIKPTAYFFVNCEPTYGRSIQCDKLKEKKIHQTSRGSSKAGVCSEERSLISPDYARNFICDFLLGHKQPITELTLFDL